LLREGLNVVIAGKPNAGKSSLLNRLAGDEIAIVTDLPGTTRDVLRQPLQLDGLTVNLIDTAGLRPTGCDRSRGRAPRPRRDVVRRTWCCISSMAPRSAPDVSAETRGVQTRRNAPSAGDDLPAGVPVAVVLNKIDLCGNTRAHRHGRDAPRKCILSAKTGEGLDLLRAHLKIVLDIRTGRTAARSARRRHLDALSRAKAIRAAGALENFSRARALELFAEDLRLAQGALGEITGEFGSDDLLGEIFRSFCIGNSAEKLGVAVGRR
jgi:tRNA modification GTPase